eukprot:7267359-Alexandrium_andersonii.AAC.1
MVPEPPDAGNGLVDRVVAQAAFSQHWVRQDRAQIAVLDRQDSKCLVAGVRPPTHHAHQRGYSNAAGWTSGR